MNISIYIYLYVFFQSIYDTSLYFNKNIISKNFKITFFKADDKNNALHILSHNRWKLHEDIIKKSLIL